MTHVRTLVIVPPGRTLDQVLGPFRDDLEVEPYRKYEIGEPRDHDAWKGQPGAPTWAEVAERHNTARSDSWPMRVDDDGRAYTISTDNPQARFEYYTVGGAFAGMLRVYPEHPGSPGTVPAEPDEDYLGPEPEARFDAAFKAQIDFEATRGAEAKLAADAWNRTHEVIGALPAPKPYRHFRALHDDDPGRYSLAQALDDFEAQEAAKALDEAKMLALDAVDQYLLGRERSSEIAFASALPGRGLLKLDGQWWLNPTARANPAYGLELSAAEADYLAQTGSYLASLPDDAWLAVLDMHVTGSLWG